MPRADQYLLWAGAIGVLLTVVMPLLMPTEPIPTPAYVHRVPDSTPYSAIVIGSTGAVGRALVRELASSFQCSRVLAVVRDSPDWRLTPGSLDEMRQIRRRWRLTLEQAEKVRIMPIFMETLDRPRTMERYAEKMKGYEKGFSALGTTSEEHIHARTQKHNPPDPSIVCDTEALLLLLILSFYPPLSFLFLLSLLFSMRSAGSISAFRAIDYNATLSLATLMRLGGTQHFNLVSSIGADRNASVTYTKTKGEVRQEGSDTGKEEEEEEAQSGERRGENINTPLCALTDASLFVCMCLACDMCVCTSDRACPRSYRFQSFIHPSSRCPSNLTFGFASVGTCCTSVVTKITLVIGFIW